jgi:hypothetical protein
LTIEFHQEEFTMSRGRFSPFRQSSLETAPIIGLWALRVLIGLGMHREFINDHGFSSDGLAQTIGLGDWIDCTRQDFDRKKVLTEMRTLHKDMETHAGEMVVPTILRDNVWRLSKLVGLSSTECRILEFAVMIRNESLLD